MLRSEHDVGDHRDNGRYTDYLYCCFNVGRSSQEMMFDLWVHMMIELWFYPYKIIGQNSKK